MFFPHNILMQFMISSSLAHPTCHRKDADWCQKFLWNSFTGCTCPHCGRRELDLESSSLYLLHQDKDLGSSFQKQLKASTWVQEKERPSLLYFDAELMFKCTFLHPLKCSAHWSFSGRSWWYNKLTRSKRLACWLFHLSAVYQLASQAIYAFWLEDISRCQKESVFQRFSIICH